MKKDVQNEGVRACAFMFRSNEQIPLVLCCLRADEIRKKYRDGISWWCVGDGVVFGGTCFELFSILWALGTARTVWLYKKRSYNMDHDIYEDRSLPIQNSNSSRRKMEIRRVSFPETQLVTGYFEPEDPLRLGKFRSVNHTYNSLANNNLTFCLS